MEGNYDKAFENLRDEGIRLSVRENNPYVYLSSHQRNEAKKDAEDLLEGDRESLAIFC